MAVRVRLDYSIQVYDPEFSSPIKGQYSVALATGNVRDFRHSVGATTTVDIWDAVDSTPASLAFFALIADGDVMVELTTDQDASVGTEVYTVKVLSGAPFVLSSNVSYANYTANFGGGTLDVIDRIRVRNLGASAVVVRGVVAV